MYCGSEQRIVECELDMYETIGGADTVHVVRMCSVRLNIRAKVVMRVNHIPKC